MERREVWLFVIDGGRMFCSCIKMGLVDRGGLR